MDMKFVNSIMHQFENDIEKYNKGEMTQEEVNNNLNKYAKTIASYVLKDYKGNNKKDYYKECYDVYRR